jgi:hypothetical protein
VSKKLFEKLLDKGVQLINQAEKECEKARYAAFHRQAPIKEAGCNRICKQFSEEHLPD